MLKRLFSALGAIVAATAIAAAANIPLLTGSQYSEPSQILATVNTLIQQVNSLTAGLLNSNPSSVTVPATTAEYTMYTYTLPSNYLGTAGQAIRARCWGSTANNVNNKSIKIYFGSTGVLQVASPANGATWIAEETIYPRTTTTGAATNADQAYLATGIFTASTAVSVVPGTFLVATSVDTTETVSNALVLKCTGTQSASATGDIVGQGFIVETIR